MTLLEEKMNGYYLPKRKVFGKKFLTGALIAAGLLYYSSTQTTGNRNDNKPVQDTTAKKDSIEEYVNEHINKSPDKSRKGYAVVFSPVFEEKVVKDTTIYRVDTTIVDTTVILDQFLNNINDDYVLVITQTEESAPFIVTRELYNKAQEVTKNATGEMEKAKMLYEWVEGLEYLPDDGRPVRNSLNTFKERSGLCLELAYLYIAAARATGLESSLVYVDEDYKGEKVNHACAEVDIEGKRILVDPAYHQFDVKHKKFRRVNDNEAIHDYHAFRR